MPALRLEVFDRAPASDGSMQPLVEVTAVEEAKVASFEQGYSAGWDDAVAAQQGDHVLALVRKVGEKALGVGHGGSIAKPCVM